MEKLCNKFCKILEAFWQYNWTLKGLRDLRDYYMVKKGQQILVCVDPLRIGAMPESKRYFPNFIYLYEQTTEDAALS